MTFCTASFILPRPMKKSHHFIYAVSILLAVLFTLPAAAMEPIQPLLAELASPNAPQPGSIERPALVPEFKV